MSDPIDWASDASYPAGSDPWSATPTKVAPSAGQIADGVRPKMKLPAQWFNYILSNFAAAILSKIEKVSPSTDRGIPRFDGMTGDLKDSEVLITDTNDVFVPGDLTVSGATTALQDLTVALDLGVLGDANVTGGVNGSNIAAALLADGDSPDANKLYADLGLKAWAKITCDGAGNATRDFGKNIGGVATAGNPYVSINILTDMSDGNYAVFVQELGITDSYFRPSNQAGGSFRVTPYGAITNFDNTPGSFYVFVVGRQ